MREFSPHLDVLPEAQWRLCWRGPWKRVQRCVLVASKQRMPAIHSAGDVDAWLAGSTDDARAALKQYPADTMRAYPVSTRVNTPKNNDETLVAAVAAA